MPEGKEKPLRSLISQGFQRRSRDLNPGTGHPVYSLSRVYQNRLFSMGLGLLGGSTGVASKLTGPFLSVTPKEDICG